MRKNAPVIAACLIDLAAVLVLIFYFATVKPPVTDFTGLLILSPPLFGLPGLILTLLARIKEKSILSVVLLIVNVIFVLWWPIFWYGGTLLFGP